MIKSGVEQCNNIIDNLEEFKVRYKVGIYDGLNAFAIQLEERLRILHRSSDRYWKNEPLGRVAGDLESTYVGFIIPAAGDSFYNLAKTHTDEGAMRYWSSKPMEPGDKILTRYNAERDFTAENWEHSHSEESIQHMSAVPMLARVILTSPMSYAEDLELKKPGDGGYPILKELIESMGPELMVAVTKSIKSALQRGNYE